MKNVLNTSVPLWRQATECAPKKEEETSARWRGTNVKKARRCGFQACDFTDETQYRLRQHKEQEGHKKQVGRP